MPETMNYLDRDLSLPKLTEGKEFATFDLYESSDIAQKTLKIISKYSTPYLKVFIYIYWNNSLSRDEKIYNISSLVDQIKSNKNLTLQEKYDDSSLIEFFLSLLKRRENLIVRIENKELMFN